MRNRNKAIGLLALGVLAGCAVLSAGCGDKTTKIEASDGPSGIGVSVSGSGKVSGKPDIARLSLGVTSEADTVQAARDKAASALNGIITALKNNGVAEKDIQTEQFSIYPQYDYNNGNQRLRAFQVMNILSVTIRNIDSTSKAVDDAVSAGGNETTIQNLTFTIDNPDDLKEQARIKAVADAKAKAETLAKAAGVSLGAAININETSYSPPVYYARDAAVAAPATGESTPIQPGELDVAVDVSITFAIQ